MNPENKKQIIIIIVAIAAGIAATLMVGTHVDSSVRKETEILAGHYEKRQAELQQKYDQDMAYLAEEIRKVRAEQAAMPAAVQTVTAAPQQPEARPAPSLALRTPDGKRAVTVLLQSLGAVGGLINPGDFVDVIAHLNVPSGKSAAAGEKDAVTVMIFQNLKILAVNTNIDSPGAYNEQQQSDALKITFAVDPQEVGLLAFAEKNGKLELALRSPNEKKHHMLEASTWNTLADYVLKNHGGNINVPTAKKNTTEVEEVEDDEDVKPYIQIFRGGKEL